MSERRMSKIVSPAGVKTEGDDVDALDSLKGIGIMLTHNAWASGSFAARAGLPPAQMPRSSAGCNGSNLARACRGFRRTLGLSHGVCPSR